MENILAIEEMQIKIQEELISLISKSIDSSTIRFWKPEERLIDDEIFSKYDDYIYNVYVIYNYKKSSNNPRVETQIGKHFDIFTNTMQAMFLRLDASQIAMLKGWSRKAAAIIANYMQEKFSYYLREVRFDFLSNESKQNFIIPNLPLKNVRFSNSPRGTERIAAEHISELFIADLKAANDFRSAILKYKSKETE